MNANDLKTILEKHKMWLNDEDGGEMADLRGADMRWADMRGADMRGAVMRGADMRGANMSGADVRWADMRWADMSGADMSGADMSGADVRWAVMRGADMRGANMSGADVRWADMRWAVMRGAVMRGANMSGADMRWADMRWADMRWADMSGADMSGADVSGAKYIDSAKNLFCPLSCPEAGEYIGFKKADGKIVKLKIPTDAKRSSSTSRKCRASKAVVVSITELDGTPAGNEVCSDYDADFVYRVGETVEAQNFDENRWNECAPGIHHYITREEAVRH